jgi:type IV secretion system protein VirD4
MSDKYGTNSQGQVKNFTMSIIVFFLLLILANQAATQYVAKVFAYHPNLGEPIYGHIYWFWKWIPWSAEYFNTYGYIFKMVYVSMAAAIIFLIVVFVILRLLVIRKAKKHTDVHGTAHWAEEDEIKEMNILDQDEGVYIGAWKDPKGKIRYLRHNGPEHILSFAPTRSGKGVGLVLPTLLSWKHSAVILDIKGENWYLTSGWREKYANNTVLKFDPSSSDGTSVKFNPLEEIRLGTPYEVGDVQNITMMILDPEGKGLSDYWSKAGFTFGVAVVLHHLYKEKHTTGNVGSLPKLYATLNDPELNITEVIEEMLEFKHIRYHTKQSVDEPDRLLPEDKWHPHPTVATAAREAANKAEAELSGVVSTVGSNLGLYSDPLIAENIKCSEFKIKDLMNQDKPVSLYLVIKPTDMDRMRPLVRIVMNQILRILIEEIKFVEGQSVKTYKHRLLLMLDEFTSLGKLEVFQNSLAYMAGYGIKSYIIIQDLTQLYNAYTKDEAIISNCHIRIAYAPNKVETAELLSKMAGTTTVVKSYTTTSGSRTSVILGQVTESYQEVSRPLLTPDECMTLPGAKKDAEGRVVEAGDMLIFIAGKAPIYGKQILFFKDPVFLDRSKVAAPTRSQFIIQCKQKKSNGVAELVEEGENDAKKSFKLKSISKFDQ